MNVCKYVCVCVFFKTFIYLHTPLLCSNNTCIDGKFYIMFSIYSKYGLGP